MLNLVRVSAGVRPKAAVYATLNPSVIKFLTARSSLSNGNLTITHTGVGDSSAQSTLIMASGQYYCEVTAGTVTSLTAVGIGTEAHENFDMPGRESSGYAYLNTGVKFSGGTQTAYGSSWTAGDVIGIALDIGAGTITFYKNGASQGVAFSSITGPFYFIVGCDDHTPAPVLTINFGQNAWANTPPAGHIGLYTQ